MRAISFKQQQTQIRKKEKKKKKNFQKTENSKFRREDDRAGQF